MSISEFWPRAVRKLQRWIAAQGGTISDQVENAYQIVLDRSADQKGLNARVSSIRAGHITILDVVRDMLNSPERAALQHAAYGHEHLQGQAAECDEHRTKAVNRLYQIILHRDADEAGLKFHVERLGRGEIELADLVQEFLDSEEYVFWFSMRENVARKIVETLMMSLTGRDPGPGAINAYTQAMTAGYSLIEFVNELTASPEFVAKHQAVSAGSHHNVPVELSILAQDLIAAQMAKEGCVIALPPIAVQGSMPSSSTELAGLIRTLAMLSFSNRAATSNPNALMPGH